MVDFSVFDSILDSAFIVDADGKVVYCNEVAATLCQVSIRRIVGKAMLADLISIKEEGILPFTSESQGRLSPTPFIETEFTISKDSRVGKGQIAVRPVDESHWAFFIRDVSLEEALYAKFRSELSQKEDYARNLEKLVEARTAELNRVNQTLNAILNSLGQGFFTFNQAGAAGDVFTKACEEILEGSPKGKSAVDILRSDDAETFRKWMDSMFRELLPFDDMKALGPSLFPHSMKKHVVLDYFPIRRTEGDISDVVVVATDKTAEHEAQLALEAERQYASMIVKYIKNKDQFLQFLVSVRQSMSDLFKIALEPMKSEQINESFRILHTLEGEAGTFSLRELRALSRVSQHILEPFKGTPGLPENEQTKYFDSLKDMSAKFEAFLGENSGVIEMPKGNVSRSVEIALEELTSYFHDLKKASVSPALIARYQERFLSVSMESCLKYFDSLLQSVSERLGKKVKPLVIEGGDIRIFPEPYQRLFSGLVHAFRNAVDHGLETPDEREWGGKDPAGQIRVQVAIDGAHMKLIVSDDGKGIDPAIIREKVKTKFPDQDFSKMSDEDVIQCVCMPGFSSRDSVGEFSGRGVGLDALREEVLKIGGTLHIESKVGAGTSLKMQLPLLGYEPVLLRSA